MEGQTASATTLAVSQWTGRAADAAILTATVAPSSATGKVTFYDGTQILGDSPVSGGVSIFHTTQLFSGTHLLRARYVGTALFASSVSAVTSYTVPALPTGGFQAPANVLFPRVPNCLTVADFNGDGIPDVATFVPEIAAPSTVLNVSLGKGDGTFGASILGISFNYSFPRTMVSGDFDGDGVSDLAVIDTGTLTILLGNGNGTFRTGNSYPENALNLVVADFNQDGFADIIGSDGNLLLGKGDGTFQPPIPVVFSDTPVVVADLNSDGIADLIFASAVPGLVLLGNGDGTFGFMNQNWLPAPQGSTMAVVDVNGDHIPDLVGFLANSFQSAMFSSLGNGDGTFQEPRVFAVTNLPQSIVTQDVNGDGRVDLITSDVVNNRIQVWFNNGDGTFTPGPTYGTGPNPQTGQGPTALFLADLNEDGLPDILTQNLTYDFSVLLSLNVSQTALAASPNPAPFGTAVTLTASISPPSAPGTVSFMDSKGIVLGSSPLFNGVASLTLQDLTAGTHTITATYSGGSNYAASISPAVIESIAGTASSITVSASPNPAAYGQHVVLTASITPASSGAVTFFDGATILGTASIQGSSATSSTTLLSAGVHSLFARYEGNPSTEGSTSPIVPEAILASPVGGFSSPIALPFGFTFGYQAAPQILEADFNGDGKTDLAIPQLSNEVLIRLGNGDGTFGPPSAVSLGVFTNSSLFSADFNGDGKVDLLSGNASAPATTPMIVLGNGDGTFQPPIVAATANLQSVAVGDYNSDGVPDFLALTSVGYLQVFSGVGNGTFLAGPVYSAPLSGQIAAVISADLNGDGRPDVLVQGSYCCAQTGTYLTALLSQGDGTFIAGSTVITGPNTTAGNSSLPEPTIVLDLNGDGKQDIVTANGSSLIVLLGNGDGTFQPPTNSTQVAVISSLTSGDFNGDGKPDVALGVGLSSIYILYGGGDGTFHSDQIINGPGLPGFYPFGSGLISVSLDSSGLTDLIAIDSPGTDVYEIRGLPASSISLTMTPAGSVSYGNFAQFTATVSPANSSGQVTFFAGPTILGTTQLNGGAASFTTNLLPSGTQSISARYSGSTASFASTSSKLAFAATTKASTGFASPGVSYNIGAQANSPVVGDFNGDGIPDLAVADYNDGTVSILLGMGDGIYQSPLTFPVGPNPGGLVVGDFNADGNSDLAVANNPGFAEIGSAISIFLGRGDGTFAAGSQMITADTSLSLLSGDFNGDGIADLVAYYPTYANTSIYFGRGDGTFQPPKTSKYGATDMVAGDFNGDGNTDLALSNGQVLLNAGDGAFQSPPVNPSPIPQVGGPKVAITGDFNGDGVLDLLIIDQGDGELDYGNVFVLVGNGNGTFRVSSQVPIFSPRSAAIGDLNGDGKLDAVVGISDGLFFLAGNGDGTLGARVQFISNSTYSSADAIAISDLSEDGIPDLMATNANSGTASVLLGTPSPCVVTAGVSSLYFGSEAGSISIPVSANQSSCSWSVTSSVPWLTFNTNTSEGSGVVSVSVPGNSLGGALTGLLTIGNSIIPVVQWGPNPADVVPGSYYETGVHLLYQKGITAGCGPNLFCPDSPISRAQMAIFMVRTIIGSDQFTYSLTPYFQDVQPTTFGFQWIQKLYELQITAGCGPGIYCPDDPVTRAQMAIFVLRARYGALINPTSPAIPYFTDVPSGSFAFAFIQKLRADSITAGCGPQTYCPSNPVTRGEMAIFLMRGGFNDLLPPASATILSVLPALLQPGQTADLTITGKGTSYLSGLTAIHPIQGITVNGITVVNPTTLVVNVTCSGGAPTGPVSIWATSYKQDSVLPNGLLVQ